MFEYYDKENTPDVYIKSLHMHVVNYGKDAEGNPANSYKGAFTYPRIIEKKAGNDYYLKGTMNNWEQRNSFKFVADPIDSNHYVLADIDLTEGDNIKGYRAGDNKWFGVSHTYDNCHFTVGENGNCVVSETGTYTVDLYVKSDDNNHLMLELHEEPEPPTPSTIKTYYFTKPSGWGTPKAYVWGSEPYKSWPGEAMTYAGKNEYNEDVYSYEFDTALYSNIIFNDGSHQTSDIKVSEFGDYNAAYWYNNKVGFWNYTPANA